MVKHGTHLRTAKIVAAAMDVRCTMRPAQGGANAPACELRFVSPKRTDV